jgi:phospholipase C
LLQKRHGGFTTLLVALREKKQNRDAWRKKIMRQESRLAELRRRFLVGASLVALLSNNLNAFGQGAANGEGTKTATPIEHVIVLIGENRTFDHLFATYQPQSSDTVSNLLSKGIVNADGSPGPNFALAQQFQAIKPFRTGYFISLGKPEKAPYMRLPDPTLNFAPTQPVFPPGTPLSLLAAVEPSLETGDLNLLTTGAASEFKQTFVRPDPDTRIDNFNKLPNGPFPLGGAKLPYDSYTGDTTHRLFEMWQQSDCDVANATPQNPSGCLSDLYPFVIINYTNEFDPFFKGIDDNGGGNSMAFYNVQQGDVPVLKNLADQFSMSDNFHQSVMGGTGANHVMLGSGDAFFWSDGQGNPIRPPSHLANPNPKPGSDDVYKVDLNFDGNFTSCGDTSQPGITAIVDYLGTLPYHPNPNCEPHHFYMVNNDSPGFLPDGTVDGSGITNGSSIPPVNTRTLGEALNEKNISWAYYGGAYRAAVELQHNPNTKDPRILVGAAYCNICNFESYTNAIMGDSSQRTAHIKDTKDFFAAVDNGNLPSVSFVKPDGLLDGHPASSKIDLFEGMVMKIVDHLNAQQDLRKKTALIITFDEGGGYYDSGYIQPLDFFGDGPRIPLIVISDFTRGGHINHTYSDHVSILKFIERNWGLSPLSARSRDNFPNPTSDPSNAYVPLNSPAIGDLFDMFNFGDRR